MNQSTYRMRRRVGGALLAGVTALGVAVVAGGGVASAAAPTVSAALTTTAPSTVPGTTNSTTAAAMSLTLNGGSVATGDTITLTIACSAANEIGWASFSTTATGWRAGTPTPGTGCTEPNVVTLTAGSTSAATTIPISDAIVASGATSGAVTVSGTYATLGAAAQSFTVPSIATIQWFKVTANVPAVTIAKVNTTSSVSNLTVAQPSGLAAFTSGSAGTINVTLSNGTFSTTPSISVVPTTAATLTATAVGLNTAKTAATASFTSVTNVAANFTFSGLSVTPTSAGPVTANITYTTGGGAPVVLANSVQLATVLGSYNQIYGQTADATVAQEFQAAFPIATGNSNAVLATDLDPYDALTASYLEGQLGTGLLITPPTSLGTDAANTLRLEGVSTVYVVGGPDAITPAVITQLQNTPAYKPGGVVPTGSNIKVVGPIYGSTAADTAQSIATYFGSAYGTLNVAGAYNTTGGAYNDTTGNASSTPPTGAVPTAFVISETDWQDATTLGPIAYADRIPVILTPAGSLGTQASAALTSLGVKQVIVVGGQLALANNVVTSIQALNGGISVLRIAGQDYTDTSVQLAKFETATGTAGLGWTPSGYLISHGDYWSDALGAAAIGGQSSFTFNGGPYGNEPILTIKNPTTVGNYTGAYLSSEANANTLNVLGGPLAVTPTVISSLQVSAAS